MQSYAGVMSHMEASMDPQPQDTLSHVAADSISYVLARLCSVMRGLCWAGKHSLRFGLAWHPTAKLETDDVDSEHALDHGDSVQCAPGLGEQERCLNL